MHEWTPDSWHNFPVLQQPAYHDAGQLERVLAELRQLPSLVFSGEVKQLRSLLAEAAQGKCFLLLGGDCAERFVDCRNEVITNKLRILLQMSLVLTYGLRKPIIRVGRIAGQFAKPRSAEYELVDGQRVPSYRGDIVNSFEPDATGRIPDPERLSKSYHCASATINYIRALIAGGFADLHYPEYWNLDFVTRSDRREDYSRVVRRIRDAIHFMDSMGGLRPSVMGRVDFFTAHEGLLLCYESALTRVSEPEQRYYNAGAHFLWIGDRTRQSEGAHVEYFRGISNPIGIKIGPGCTPAELIALLPVLNPQNEWGRITLITRLGAKQVEELLPPLINAVQQHQQKVLWSCDPMHGNTTTTDDGVKTRDFDRILLELRRTFAIHQAYNSILGGVMFELTGEDVTECTGGSQMLGEQDLSINYQSYCDPRLNYAQSLEMAFQIAGTELV